MKPEIRSQSMVTTSLADAGLKICFWVGVATLVIQSANWVRQRFDLEPSNQIQSHALSAPIVQTQPSLLQHAAFKINALDLKSVAQGIGNFISSGGALIADMNSIDAPAVPQGPEAAAPDAAATDATLQEGIMNPDVKSLEEQNPDHQNSDEFVQDQTLNNLSSQRQSFVQNEVAPSSADKQSDQFSGLQSMGGAFPAITPAKPAGSTVPYGTTSSYSAAAIATQTSSSADLTSGAASDSLQSSDILWLLRNFNGNFADTMTHVAGKYCPTAQTCRDESNLQTHTLRWNKTTGIKVGGLRVVAVRSESTMGLRFQVAITLLTKTGNRPATSRILNVSLQPTTVSVDGGANARVARFQFADTQVENESLRGIELVVNQADAGSLLKFYRVNFQSISERFDPNMPVPGSKAYIIPNRLDYSASLSPAS